MISTNRSDAVIYYSTAASSTGGAITATKVQNKVVQNGFASIDLAEAILGSVTYWGGYIKNDSLTEDGSNFTLFIDPNTPHETDEVTIGLDPAGLNGVMQTIATNLIAPVGVEFFLAPTYNQGVFIGKLKHGEWYPFWLKRVITATRVEQKRNNFFVNIGFDPPPGNIGGGSGSGSGSGGSGGGTGGGGTGGGGGSSDLDIAVDGDWGTSSGTKSTIDNILNFDTIKHTIVVGDISYESKGDKWRDMTANLRKDGKTMYWCPGNHEYSDGSGLVSFYKGLFGTDKTYGSAVIGNILLVYGDMYIDYGTGSDQYKFIKKALEDAKNNASILWKICIFHEPLFGSKSDHGNKTKWRDTYFPLYTENGVDITLNGHNHHYERTFPLKWDGGSTPEQVSVGQDPNYTDPGGTICLTVGLGGHDVQYEFKGSRTDWSAAGEDTFFGFLMLSLSENGRKITGKLYKNSNHTLVETWSITKA